jgi:hypothetical protein
MKILLLINSDAISENIDDVKERIPNFIKQVYNTKRLYSALSCCSPDKFEEILENKAQEKCQGILNLSSNLFQG